MEYRNKFIFSLFTLLALECGGLAYGKSPLRKTEIIRIMNKFSDNGFMKNASNAKTLTEIDDSCSKHDVSQDRTGLGTVTKCADNLNAVKEIVVDIPNKNTPGVKKFANALAGAGSVTSSLESAVGLGNALYNKDGMEIIARTGEVASKGAGCVIGSVAAGIGGCAKGVNTISDIQGGLEFISNVAIDSYFDYQPEQTLEKTDQDKQAIQQAVERRKIREAKETERARLAEETERARRAKEAEQISASSDSSDSSDSGDSSDDTSSSFLDTMVKIAVPIVNTYLAAQGQATTSTALRQQQNKAYHSTPPSEPTHTPYFGYEKNISNSSHTTTGVNPYANTATTTNHSTDSNNQQSYSTQEPKQEPAPMGKIQNSNLNSYGIGAIHTPVETPAETAIRVAENKRKQQQQQQASNNNIHNADGFCPMPHTVGICPNRYRK